MAEGYLKNDPTFATRAIHEGNEPEQWRHLAVVPPITLATTYKQDAPGKFRVRTADAHLWKEGKSGIELACFS